MKSPAHRTGEKPCLADLSLQEEGSWPKATTLPRCALEISLLYGATYRSNRHLLGSGPQSGCATSTELRTSFRHRSMSRSLNTSWLAPK